MSYQDDDNFEEDDDQIQVYEEAKDFAFAQLLTAIVKTYGPFDLPQNVWSEDYTATKVVVSESPEMEDGLRISIE